LVDKGVHLQVTIVAFFILSYGGIQQRAVWL